MSSLATPELYALFDKLCTNYDDINIADRHYASEAITELSHAMSTGLEHGGYFSFATTNRKDKPFILYVSYPLLNVSIGYATASQLVEILNLIEQNHALRKRVFTRESA